MAFSAEQAEPGATIQEFLKRRARLERRWQHFHLADNRKDEEAPFASLATYTSGSRRTTKPSTSPSARRSASTRGRPNKERLLLPVQRGGTLRLVEADDRCGRLRFTAWLEDECPRHA